MSNFNRPSFYNNWTDGDPTKVTQPDAGTLLSGWTAGEPPPFQYDNWLEWNTDQWIQFFDPVITVTAGELLAANTAVYISDGTDSRTAGRAYKCDAGSVNGSVRHRFIGFTVAQILSASQGPVVMGGKMSGFTSLVEGSIYWVDPSTPGAITATQPTTGTFPNAWLVPVGVALSTTVLLVNYALSGVASQIAAAVGAGVGTGGIVSLDPATQTPHTLTTGESGVVFWVKSANGKQVMNLPTPQNGLVFTVVDLDCNFDNNPATWHRHGSEKIQGIASDFKMEAPGGVWSIESNGTDWAFSAR